MRTIVIKTLPAIFLFLFQSISFGGIHIIRPKFVTTYSYYPLPTKPVAQNDSIRICENSGMTSIPVQANDSDADGDPLSTSIYSGPKNGSASISGKSINYTPAANFTGNDTIEYVVCDTNLPANCDTAFVFITVNPSPLAITGPNRTMCYGDTISIGGSAVAGKTYKWTPNNGLSSYNVSNPLASPADTTKYYLTVTDTVTGCIKTDSVIILVKPVPTADITPGDTASFCMGDSITLTATNGVKYAWSTGDTTKNIIVTSPGKYYVGVTYSNGCTDYADPTTVFINPLPVAQAGPDKLVCIGDSVRIGSVAISGMSYSWTPSSGLSSNTIAQPEASPAVTTTYILVVTDTLSGCKKSDTVIIKVLPQPIANAGPDKSICKGDSTLIGTPPAAGVSYKWSPSTGLNSDTVAQPNAKPANTTTYILTASNGTCNNKDTVIVSVFPQPIANVGPSSFKSICKDDSTIIGAAPVSGVSYSWSPPSGLRSDTSSQTTASPAVTTTYTLTASNGICSNKDSVTVIVNPKPVANAGPDQTICRKDSVTIGSAPISGVSYSWSPSTGLSSSITSDPTASPAVTTTYVLTASNGTCSNTDSVTIAVNPLPVVNAGPNKSICKGDSTTIGSAAISGVSYSWTPASGLSSDTVSQPVASPSATTTYILTVSNGTCFNKDTVVVSILPQPSANAGSDKTICKGDSTTIGTPPISGVSYNWVPSTGLSSPIVSNPTASPAVTTTYVLTTSNGACSNKDSVTVIVNPLPAANAGPNKTICNGDSTTIGTPTVAGITYSWAPPTGLSSSTISQPTAKPGITTTYTLTVSNGTCTNTDIVLVTVLPQPLATVGSDKNICNGDSVTIGAPPMAGVSYTWAPANGLNSSTIAQPNASPAVTTTYTLTTSNGFCTNKDSVTITVYPPPIANAGPDNTICRGDSVAIGTSSTPGLSYSWTPVSGLSSSTSSQPNASPLYTTQYVLTVTNSGCSKTDTVRVTVNPLPAANVGAGQQTICDAGSITLGAQAVAGDIYVWTPAMGLNSTTISQPVATPSSTTLYTLVETDTSTGCSMSNQVLITVEPNDFYTGISPNGDGINDWWNIPMLDCYPNNSVIIVNRWGSEVWSATNYDNVNLRWAGKDMAGTDLPDGTYYYIIKYNNTEKQGWVFIKR